MVDSQQTFIGPGWPGYIAGTFCRGSAAAGRTEPDAQRAQVQKTIGMPVIGLDQVHGNRTVTVTKASTGLSLVADGLFTADAGLALSIRTADCLPILLVDQSQGHLAAVHAGWRGLVSGVIENAVELFSDPGKLTVWLGPAISQPAFEVGSKVRDAFLAAGSDETSRFFEPNENDRWQADLYGLARQRLVGHGVSPDRISGGDYCTYRQHERFFSYRRGDVEHRLVTVIGRIHPGKGDRS